MLLNNMDSNGTLSTSEDQWVDGLIIKKKAEELQ